MAVLNAGLDHGDEEEDGGGVAVAVGGEKKEKSDGGEYEEEEEEYEYEYDDYGTETGEDGDGDGDGEMKEGKSLGGDEEGYQEEDDDKGDDKEESEEEEDYDEDYEGIEQKKGEEKKIDLYEDEYALDEDVGTDKEGGDDDEYENQDHSQQNKSKTSYASSSSACKDAEVLKNTDFWGNALNWGTKDLVESAQECCELCASYKPKSESEPACNVWVYCEDEDLCKDSYQQCWIKYLAHPGATAPAAEGATVGWTTGIMPQGTTDDNTDVDPNEDRRYHVVISAQGSATHWQSRVHYYWYKKIKMKCEKEGKCDMGGFTRILHSGEPDELMDEIPTFVANTLPPEHPHHGYIVLNRPYAFLQWIEKATIAEKFVLMCEPDHLWLKPMPNLMKGHTPAAFPFFYIEPTKSEFLHLTERFVGKLKTVKEKEQLAPIGSSPTMMTWDDMKKVVPLWFNLSIAVHNDKEAVEKWGWIQEMYAFTLSMYKAGIKNIGLHLKMMSQPPYDSDLDKFYILHYTYGMDYDLNGKFTPGAFYFR